MQMLSGSRRRAALLLAAVLLLLTSSHAVVHGAKPRRGASSQRRRPRPDRSAAGRRVPQPRQLDRQRDRSSRRGPGARGWTGHVLVRARSHAVRGRRRSDVCASRALLDCSSSGSPRAEEVSASERKPGSGSGARPGAAPEHGERDGATVPLRHHARHAASDRSRRVRLPLKCRHLPSERRRDGVLGWWRFLEVDALGGDFSGTGTDADVVPVFWRAGLLSSGRRDRQRRGWPASTRASQHSSASLLWGGSHRLSRRTSSCEPCSIPQVELDRCRRF